MKVSEAGRCIECPNPLFTDRFTAPGDMENVINSLEGNERSLAAAFLMYYRGDTDGACRSAKAILSEPGSFYTQVGAALLLSLCAMYKGDVSLWEKSARLAVSAPYKDESEHSSLEFWTAALASALHDDSKFPDWLKRGKLDVLPFDSHPSAWFFYAKELYIICKDYHRKGDKNPQKHIEAMRVLPLVLEPLISEAKREGIYLCELYLRLLCAIAYYYLGEAGLCNEHAERAIALALPDRLYSPLAEHASLMGYVLYDRLYETDREAFDNVKRLASLLGTGWVELHNASLGRQLISNLSLREYEVSSLAAYNMSNKEIAGRLHLSVGTVKQVLHTAMGKANVSTRGELGRLV